MQLWLHYPIRDTVHFRVSEWRMNTFNTYRVRNVRTMLAIAAISYHVLHLPVHAMTMNYCTTITQTVFGLGTSLTTLSRLWPYRAYRLLHNLSVAGSTSLVLPAKQQWTPPR